jgi:hypothetical protein
MLNELPDKQNNVHENTHGDKPGGIVPHPFSVSSPTQNQTKPGYKSANADGND